MVFYSIEAINICTGHWENASLRVVETQFWDGLLPTLSNRDATLLRSQGALSRRFHSQCFPWIDPQPFRVLLLRRLRLQFLLTARSCVCGRLLDTARHAQLLGSLGAGDIL